MNTYSDALRTLKNTKVAFCGEDYARSIDAAIRCLESMTGDQQELLWNVESKDTPNTDSDHLNIGGTMLAGSVTPVMSLRHMANCARFYERKSNNAIKALRGILEIGRRDLSNPKYDTYFIVAKDAVGYGPQ